ncbi:MAG: T9SS type A sorting domain-containing protein, partial [Saprospiraceae bacterium]|nr:T9SS type A sorting domain-containing protein [Saprospiraceae bacterium]
VKTSNTIENGMVIIYDSNGQKIMKSLLIDKSIEIAQPLPIGIYNIQLYTKHHTVSKKLLIK